MSNEIPPQIPPAQRTTSPSPTGSVHPTPNVPQQSARPETAALSADLVKNLQQAGLEPGRSYLAQVETIVGSRSQEATAMQAILRISTANRFLVETHVPLKAGDAVWVKAAENNQLLVRLRDNATTPIDRATLAKLISEIMPRQQTLTHTLNSLITGITQNQLRGFSQSALNLVVKLIADLPNLQLSAGQSAEAAKLATAMIVKGNLMPRALQSLAGQSPANPAGPINQASSAQTGAHPAQGTSGKVPDNFAAAVQRSLTTLLKNTATSESREGVIKLTPDLRNALTSLADRMGAPKAGPSPQNSLKAILGAANQLNAAIRELAMTTRQHLTAPSAQLPATSPKPALIAQTLQKSIDSALKPLQSLSTLDIGSRTGVAGTPSHSATPISPVLTSLSGKALQGIPANLLPAVANTAQASLQLAIALDKSISTEVVKSMVQRSGGVTEATLRQMALGESHTLATKTQTSSPPLPGDMKTNLLQLMRALDLLSRPPPHPGALADSTASGATAATSGVVANPAVLGATNPELMATPFDFPKFASAQASRARHYQVDLTVGEALRQLAGALNRIQFNQLNSLYQAQTQTTDTAQVQTWLFDLPVVVDGKQTEPLQLRLEKETPRKEAAKKKLGSQWKITLGFDFAPMGPIQVELRFRNNALDSTIWARDASTLRLIHQEVPKFRQQLLDLGVDVKDIACQRGMPRRASGPIEHRLVDIHT